MNERIELYKHIYQDSEMSCYSLKTLQKDLKEKNNKIKDLLEKIYLEYEKYKKNSKKIIKRLNGTIDKNSLMSKIMANMGIKKEVISDNSDSSIADMLIQGISMGSINTERKIKDYKDSVLQEDISFANEFLKFQENSIEQLKEYL